MTPTDSPRSTDPQVERCLSSIRELSNALARDLYALSPEAWDGPTNCTPWRVRDLAAHVVGSGEGFVDCIRQGLAGSVQPIASNEERHRRQAELEAANPAAIAGALQAVTAEFSALYDGLQEAQLSAICFHQRGNRSVRWYAAHRLAEVAFHSWDLQLSLQETPLLEDRVAALVLPTLLESNAPRIYAAGLSQQRGNGERFLLGVIDDPPARWLVTIDPDKLEVRRGDAVADLQITGSAAELALLIYGRIELRAAHESGSVRLDGDLTLVDRFSLVFPRP
jgi:uncharacterized protein (TIGR03083 family)